MRFVLTAGLVLFSAAAYGQCDSCADGSAYLMRGDVDNDGSLTVTDLGLVFSSTVDAGDVNDDGSINITDVSYLSAYMFQQGPPPPCPFPLCGLDCTADDIDVCCSPPLSANAPGGYDNIVMEATELESEDQSLPEWDRPLCGLPNCSGDPDVTIEDDQFDIEHYQAHDCEGIVLRNRWNFTWAGGNDAIKMTENRVDNGVQTPEVDVLLSATFSAATPCTIGSGQCQAGTNVIRVLLPSVAWVKLTGKARQLCNVTWSDSETSLVYKYWQKAGTCQIASNDPQNQASVGSVDLGPVLDQLDECNEDDIESVEMNFLHVDWFTTGTSPDLSEDESCELSVSLSHTYEWCNCGS
jgi:hypothetical protein